jgi:hypothetical protein
MVAGVKFTNRDHRFGFGQMLMWRFGEPVSCLVGGGASHFRCECSVRSGYGLVYQWEHLSGQRHTCSTLRLTMMAVDRPPRMMKMIAACGLPLPML